VLLLVGYVILRSFEFELSLPELSRKNVQAVTVPGLSIRETEVPENQGGRKQVN